MSCLIEIAGQRIKAGCLDGVILSPGLINSQVLPGRSWPEGPFFIKRILNFGQVK